MIVIEKFQFDNIEISTNDIYIYNKYIDVISIDTYQNIALVRVTAKPLW